LQLAVFALLDIEGAGLADFDIESRCLSVACDQYSGSFAADRRRRRRTSTHASRLLAISTVV
jgi:hypothetical protein